MPVVEYRLKGDAKSQKRQVRYGSDVIKGKPDETYELREVGTERWQECETDSNGKIELYITLDGGVQPS